MALLLVWTFFYSLAYVVLGVTAYGWCAVPLVVPIAILTAAGSRTFMKWARIHLKGVPAIQRCVPIVLLGAIALPNWVAASEFATRPPDRTVLYPETGEWFMVNAPPVSSIGTLEVGIIGYTAHRTIIDFAGLIQPGITDAADPALGFDGLALAAWQSYRPDFVAMLRPGISTITSDQAFREQCRVIHSIDHPDVVDVMDIYACS